MTQQGAIAETRSRQAESPVHGAAIQAYAASKCAPARNGDTEEDTC